MISTMLTQIIEEMEMREFVIRLVFTYAAVIVAMIIDFISGLRKAQKAHIATTSRGYKMTCTKAYQYFFPMLCLTCVDVIGSVVLSYPAFTMIMAAFNIFCEWKSVLESTADKKKMRDLGSALLSVLEEKPEFVKTILHFLKDDDSKDDEEDK